MLQDILTLDFEFEVSALFQLLSIEEVAQDTQVLCALLLQMIVCFQELLFVMCVQDPMIVAQHEIVATLHRQAIPNLNLSLHRPFVHLQTQIHRTVDRLIMEILSRNSLADGLKLVGSV